MVMDATAKTRPARADAAQLLAEGVAPLLDAARAAGLRPLPSLRTLLRAAISGRLESLKVAGRRLTSAAAVVRWVARSQQRAAAPEPAPVADPGAVLSRYGLAREVRE